MAAAAGACGDDGGAAGGTGGSAGTGGHSGGGTGAAAGSGGGGGSAGAHAGGGGTGGAGGGALFSPAVGTSWQWQLSGLPIDQSFEVAAYDVDLFTTSDTELSTLHAAGRAIICYFSAGSWESGRPDSGDFPGSVKGSPLDPPFQDELWLDVRAPEVRSLMQVRLELAASRGCDAVEPDNVDGYSNQNGFGLSAADQLDFNSWLAAEAHARGLSVGLKNDTDQLDALESQFDWALNEECFSYNECGKYQNNFLAAGKAVFHAEYVGPAQLATVCGVTKPLGLSTLLKHIELDAWQLPCP